MPDFKVSRDADPSRGDPASADSPSQLSSPYSSEWEQQLHDASVAHEGAGTIPLETQEGLVQDMHLAGRAGQDGVSLSTMRQWSEASMQPVGRARRSGTVDLQRSDLSPGAQGPPPLLVPRGRIHDLTPPERPSEELRRPRLDDGSATRLTIGSRPCTCPERSASAALAIWRSACSGCCRAGGSCGRPARRGPRPRGRRAAAAPTARTPATRPRGSPWCRD